MANQKDTLMGIIETISKKLIEAEKTLTDLDSPAGDADCGSGVRRGFEAVTKIIPDLGQMELGDILKKVGFTLAYTIGGTSGAMLGTGFIETGKSIGDKKEPDAKDWITALENALSVIKRRGGNTQIGDKTLVDSLEPAIRAMESLVDTGQAPGSFQSGIQSGSSQMSMSSIIEAAVAAAKAGSDQTIEMVARKGRASYLGERSKGHRDPGSLIIVIMFEAALESMRR
ncbi:MAG: dihydroxyacetone kinase subunit DhaL [Actinobacteria bacterium]|nr:dihydroxyacetone kinase subunit DhaL [Actinomycetota bacterium]